MRIHGAKLTMATVIITFKLMMDSPDTDIDVVKKLAKDALAEMGGEIGKDEVEEVAFGLKALKLMVVADEKLGSDAMETRLSEIEGVSSVKIDDYRRALG